jgi:hypothetical protein
MFRPEQLVARMMRRSGSPGYGILNVTAPVWAGALVGIGKRDYVCADGLKRPPMIGGSAVPVWVSVGAASGLLHVDDSVVPTDGSSVTVGGKVYTFRDTLSGADGEVQRGLTVNRCFYNLAAAMNVGLTPEDAGCESEDVPPLSNDIGQGKGVAYSSNMSPNPMGVLATYGGDNDFNVAHRLGGTAGNAVDTSCSLPGTSAWLNGVKLEPVEPPSADAFLTALEEAINSDGLGPARASRKSVTELLCFGRGVIGKVGLRAVFTEAGNGWGDVKLTGRRGQSTRPPVFWGVTRTVEDWEATQGSAVMALRRWPRGFIVQVRGAAGELVAFDGTAKAEGRNVILSAAGSVALAAGMTITVIAY